MLVRRFLSNIIKCNNCTSYCNFFKDCISEKDVIEIYLILKNDKFRNEEYKKNIKKLLDIIYKEDLNSKT